MVRREGTVGKIRVRVSGGDAGRVRKRGRRFHRGGVRQRAHTVRVSDLVSSGVLRVVGHGRPRRGREGRHGVGRERVRIVRRRPCVLEFGEGRQRSLRAEVVVLLSFLGSISSTKHHGVPRCDPHPPAPRVPTRIRVIRVGPDHRVARNAVLPIAAPRVTRVVVLLFAVRGGRGRMVLLVVGPTLLTRVNVGLELLYGPSGWRWGGEEGDAQT